MRRPAEPASDPATPDGVSEVDPPPLRYEPALDGLRAVAIIAVLLFHDNIGRNVAAGVLPGGFLGVDVFFVLSGFLITSVLLRDHAVRGRVISWSFWARRLRRLVPALLILVLLVAAYAAIVAEPFQLGAIRRQGFGALFYVENWVAIRTRVGQITPFSHMWSLAIEEQWYLLWPLLLAGLLLAARGRPRRLLVGIALLAAISLAWMIFGFDESSYQRVAAGTDTRAWQLLLGAMVAVAAVHPPGIRVRSRTAGVVVDVMAIAGLAFFAWAVTTVRVLDHWMNDGGLVIVAAATIAVIVAALQPESLVRGCLSWRPLVWIGLISYGLYLYHLVVYAWFSPERTGVSGTALLVIRLAVTVALAAISYVVVERPIRRGSISMSWSRALLPAAFGLAAVALWLSTTGADATLPTSATLAHYRELVATTPAGVKRVLVVGDETALDLGLQVRSPVDRDGIRGTVAGACGIAGGTAVDRAGSGLEGCRPWEVVYREAVGAFRPDVVVVMTGTTEVFDRRVGGRVLRVGTVEYARYLSGRLELVREVVGRGRPLVLLTVPCMDPVANHGHGEGFGAVRGDASRVAWVNQVWRDFAAAHPETVSVAGLDEVLCPAGNPHARIGSFEFRPNGVNLSPTGAGVTWQWLAPIARTAADSGPGPERGS